MPDEDQLVTFEVWPPLLSTQAVQKWKLGPQIDRNNVQEIFRGNLRYVAVDLRYYETL